MYPKICPIDALKDDILEMKIAEIAGLVGETRNIFSYAKILKLLLSFYKERTFQGFVKGKTLIFNASTA
jgi:hypothetical protein